MPLDNLNFGASYLRGKDAWTPQQANQGIIRIEDLPNTAGDPQQVEMALSTFSLPKASHNVTEKHYLNDIIKYAGKRTYDDITIELTQYVDPDIQGIIFAWWNTIKNDGGPIGNNAPGGLEVGAMGLPRNYKKSADIYLFRPDGETVRAYELDGVFPTNVDPGDMDMSSDEHLQMSITLSIDRFRYVGDNVNQGTNI